MPRVIKGIGHVTSGVSQWMIRAVINNLSPIVITLMSSCTNTFCYNTAGRAFVNGPEMGHQ